MMKNLWQRNHPAAFWLCQPELSDEVWAKAVAQAIPLLGFPDSQLDMDAVLALTLGESRFGSDHWELSLPKKVYYLLKPIIPRWLTKPLRRIYSHSNQSQSKIQWPIEPRYVEFMWEVMRQIIQISDQTVISIKSFWPMNKRFSLVLTHDIEGKAGQEYVRVIADLEESLGFRSSFQFVPEAYEVDLGLIQELRERGFEVGIHGLKHDGKLFSSLSTFQKRASRINAYLEKWNGMQPVSAPP